MNDKELNDVLTKIVSFLDEHVSWDKIYGLENIETSPNQIMSLSLIVEDNGRFIDVYSAIDKSEYLREYRNVDNYVPEDVHANRSHTYEEK